MTLQQYEAECRVLQDWIKKRKARREGTGDLSARLVALRARQLRAEIKEERKQRRTA